MEAEGSFEKLVMIYRSCSNKSQKIVIFIMILAILLLLPMSYYLDIGRFVPRPP
jgi:hypothetical protein